VSVDNLGYTCLSDHHTAESSKGICPTGEGQTAAVRVEMYFDIIFHG